MQAFFMGNTEVAVVIRYWNRGDRITVAMQPLIILVFARRVATRQSHEAGSGRDEIAALRSQ